MIDVIVKINPILAT